MRGTNAPRPVARPAGRDETQRSAGIVTPSPAPSFDLRPWATANGYRIQLDESRAHERDPEACGDGRDFVEVPCLRGKLYPVGVATVGAWTSTRGVLTELLALDPAVYVRQRGDSEAVVAFPPPLLDAVAGILRPRRRRTLAPERARAIGSGTAFSGAQRLEDAPGRTAQARDEETAEVRA